MDALIQSYPLQPVNVLQWVVICSYGFACLLLWNNPRVRALCGFLLLEILLMLFNFSEETGIFGQRYLITPIFAFCTGPAFYLFVRHLVYADQAWTRRDWIHALPAVLALPLTAYSQWLLAAASVSLVAYGVAAFLRLRAYRHAAESMCSDAEDRQLQWLVRIMLVFAVLGLTDIVRLNLQPVLAYEILNSWYFFHTLAVYFLFMSLVYGALCQAYLFDGLRDYETDLAADSNTDSDSLQQGLFEQLHQHIVDAEMFRQPRLSLADVANSVGWNSKEVSEVINAGGDRNFNDYINGLRVDAVKESVHEMQGQKINLLEIAIAAGFNSKTSFNSCFKRLTGMTPSQYQKSL